MKNAYFQYLLEHRDNFKIPKENEEIFTNIAEEYNEFGTVFNEFFEITKNKENKVNKDLILETIRSKIKISWRTLLSEIKKTCLERLKE